MITKEQFLNGAEFKVDSIGPFKFEPRESIDKFDAVGTIERVYRHSKTGESLFTDYECNVEKITNKTITYYKSVMGKFIKNRIKFEDMEEYIPPQEIQ